MAQREMVQYAQATPVQTGGPQPVVGLVAGAAIGAVVAGPIGAVIGGVIGCNASSRPSITTHTPGPRMVQPVQQSYAVQTAQQSYGAQPAQQSTLGVNVRLPREAMQMVGGTQFYAVDVTPVQGGQSWRLLKRYNDFDQLKKFFDVRQWGASSDYAGFFPIKHMTGCTGARLEERRRQLEAWLQRAVCHPNAECLRGVRGFLNVPASNQGLHAGAAQIAVAMPMAVPQAAYPMATPQVAQGYSMAAPVAYPTARAPASGYPMATPIIAPQAAVVGAPVLQRAASGSAGSSLSRTVGSGLARGISREVVQSAQAPGEAMEIQVPEGVSAGQVISITVPDGRQATLTLPAGSVAGSSLSLLFDPATGTISSLQQAPAQQAPAAVPLVEASSTVMMQVPPGVSAGQLIAVTVPNGRQVNFALPDGAREGEVLRLWFDPISNSLMHMP